MRWKVKNDDTRPLNQTQPTPINYIWLLQRYSVKRALTSKNPFLLKKGLLLQNIYI